MAHLAIDEGGDRQTSGSEKPVEHAVLAESRHGEIARKL
jgi:hypothetical protein